MATAQAPWQPTMEEVRLTAAAVRLTATGNWEPPAEGPISRARDAPRVSAANARAGVERYRGTARGPSHSDPTAWGPPLDVRA
ncbi:MAG: hypothetical protein B7Z66_12995 [Chromatiales bacterium 21-64-14]|nr:MAG: hypothetical protein B7Z66_12995 [Chromatiales bacterium 21-64-14]